MVKTWGFPGFSMANTGLPCFTRFTHMFWPFFRHIFAHHPSPSSPSTWPALEPRSSARHHQNLRSYGTPGIHGFLLKWMKNGWKLDEKWMKHGWTKTWCTPLYAQFIIQSPVRNSKFESSYVIMFLFQLATFWETLLLCGFALLVGHTMQLHMRSPCRAPLS